MPPSTIRTPFYDPQACAEPFQLGAVNRPAEPYEPARTNYFTILHIAAGVGDFWADAAQHPFRADQLLFFVPYQHIRLVPTVPLQATLIHFHANFLCVETFHAETGCSGTLFNDPYGPPLVPLETPAARADVAELLARMARENERRELAYEEAALASLRLLLIAAARLKSASPAACAAAADYRHPLLGPLRDLIEQHYRTLHAPADYAGLLHVTPKTLGRVVREHLGQTLTDLIRSRILTHAKWQLLHTLRPVKEIAAEVGFHDELYFSRLFKKSTGVSPVYFREFETRIRGGSNLAGRFA